MSSQRAGRVAAAVLALTLSAPAAGSAGNGVRLGGSEGRLHPFFEVEDRYDSNVYYSDVQKPVGDMVLHLRPGFELTVPGEMTAAELTGSLDWAQYMGLDLAQTKTRLSKLYGQSDVGVSLNRRGQVGLELDDEFRRAPGTNALILTNAVISNYNTLRARVPFRPGGGALVFTANGTWTLETFDSYFTAGDCPGCTGAVGKYGYNEFRSGGDVKWKFLPRTAAMFQGGWFTRLPNDSAAPNVNGVEAQVGLVGLVTPHLGATLKAGYSGTYGVATGKVATGSAAIVSLETGNLSTWLSTVEAEWIATDSASVKAGWTHGLGIDPGPALYTSNRVYGTGRILLAGRYGIRFDATFESRAYSPGSASASLVRLEPAFEAGIARWMSASLGYAYSRRTSSSLPATFAPLPVFDYSKNETWLRVSVRY
jgi:hypothetical protein